MNRTLLAVIAALALITSRDALAQHAEPPYSGFHLVSRTPLGDAKGWDYLAFESDAEMPTARLVADLIFDLLTGRKDGSAEIDFFDQLRRGISLDPPAVHITPVDRSRGYAQFKGPDIQ